MSTQSYYDIRGQKQIANQVQSYGSKQLSESFRAPHEEVESIFERELKPQSKVLDLCCGTGVHSIYPAKLGHMVTGVDFSEKSIDAARKMAKDFAVEDRCQFLAMDALDFLKKNKNSFDMIHISGSLYYFDLNEILPLIQEALKVDGIFLSVGTSGSSPVGQVIRRIKQLLTGYRDEATMTRLLKVKNIKQLQGHFMASHIEFFCFLVLIAQLLPQSFGLRSVLARALKPLDQFILNLGFLNFLGFKYVFWGRKKS